MPWAAAAAVVAAGVTYYATTSAADTAAEAQTSAAQAGIGEERYQFNKLQEVLAPYVSAGTGALTEQQALVGLGGDEAQKAAIERIKASPLFSETVRQGEEALLQKASATGGVRGGNVQAALAQYRPQILSQLIESQYSKLGGISQLGQASAAGVGSAGMQTGANIANLLQQQGAAQAGAVLAGGQAISQGASDVAGTLALLSAQGKF